MLASIRINLGLLTVEQLIRSQLVSITSASLSHTPLRITLLLVMDKTYLLLILVLFLFHLLSLIFNLIMSLEYPQLLLTLLLFINFVMTTTIGAILMKILFPSRPWTQGKFSTRARVKVQFTPSILIMLLSFSHYIEFVIMFLGILISIRHFGI